MSKVWLITGSSRGFGRSLEEADGSRQLDETKRREKLSRSTDFEVQP